MGQFIMSHFIWIYAVCKSLLLSPVVVKELMVNNAPKFENKWVGILLFLLCLFVRSLCRSLHYALCTRFSRKYLSKCFDVSRHKWGWDHLISVWKTFRLILWVLLSELVLCQIKQRPPIQAHISRYKPRNPITWLRRKARPLFCVSIKASSYSKVVLVIYILFSLSYFSTSSFEVALKSP